jgi:flagellar basal-body rod protein FlgB
VSDVPKFDPLAFHAASLRLRTARHQMLAANLANADTPGFKARDVDFAQALREQLGADASGRRLGLSATDGRHLSPQGAARGRSDPGFRAAMQPALDGNTVDPDVERAQFADNVFRTEAALSFLNSALRSRLSAITGQ